MNLTKSEYKKLSEKKAPKSPLLKNCACAFVIGGIICAAGQLLLEWYEHMGVQRDKGVTLVAVSLIFLSVLLTGIGVYDKIASFGGAGTLVPITGFANSMAAPALEFKTEGFITGLGTKMFIIAGPVIVYGISSSIIYGLIYYLFK